MSPQLEHTLAAVLLEIAYLAAGVLLCYFGKDMLEKGIKGSFRGDGKAVSATFRVVTSSPGLVFMLAGLVIIGLAIRTQAKFSQGIAGTPAGTQQGQEPSLGELASRVVVSQFAEASTEQRFALGQLDAARTHLEKSDQPSAMLALVNAVTVNPVLLTNVLKDPQFSRLTADERFGAIVRERFKLPLIAAPLQSRVHPVLGELGLFASDRRDDAGGSDALRQFPANPNREPLEITAERLRTSLVKSPRALYAMLRKPDYDWVFETPPLVEALRSGIAKLEDSRPES
jgi:hypothetical protein